MEDQSQPSEEVPAPGSKSGRAVKVALVGAGIAAGAIGATALGANAASSDSSSSTSPAYSSTGAPAGEGRPDGPGPGRPGGPGGNGGNPHGPNPVRSDEKSLSADIVAKLKAAALKAVPGGTVYRVETDSGDAAFEAHMTKSDGTEVTVKFDKNYNVTGVEDGMGR